MAAENYLSQSRPLSRCRASMRPRRMAAENAGFPAELGVERASLQ